MSGPIDVVLSRLPGGGRPTGPRRWIARSPLRDDSTPSLSIRETDDGRVLLHDFGGGTAAEIVDALGLELRDLFPARDQRSDYGSTPRPRRTHAPRIPAEDVLRMLDYSAIVVQSVAGRILDGAEITTAEYEAVADAATRIGYLRDSWRAAA